MYKRVYKGGELPVTVDALGDVFVLNFACTNAVFVGTHVRT